MTDVREDWVAAVVGQALNPDRMYGNQCVDTVDHFGQFIFGVPWQQCVGGVSGARQLLDAAPDEYWERIDYYHGFTPQRFDVGVMGGDDLNPWGHTFVTESADNIGINVIQQDGFAAPTKFVDGAYYSDKPAHRARLAYSDRGTGPLLGVLRPRLNKLIPGSTINLASAIITELQEAGVALEHADKVFVQEVVNGMGDRLINDNREQAKHYAAELAQVVRDNAYQVKVFTQEVVNPRFDGVDQILNKIDEGK